MRTRAIWGALALGVGTGKVAFAEAALAQVTMAVQATDAHVELALPASAPGSESRLLVEVDGYDVTALIERLPESLRVPVAGLQLAPGPHPLRVLEERANGDIDVVLERTLDVYQRTGVRSASQRWATLLSSSYRVDAHPDETYAGSNRSSGNGSFEWIGDRQTQGWQATGALHTLYDSEQAPGFGQNAWQLPVFQARLARTIGNAHVAVGLGDTSVAQDGLVFGGFGRRGLRLEGSALEQRLQAQVFTLHSDPVTHLGAALTPTDSRSSLVGMNSTLAPLAAHPDALRVSLSWVDGASSLSGAGIGSGLAATPVGGTTWSFAVDSFAAERSVWLRLEHGASRFDGDGIGFGDPERDGHATEARLQLTSSGKWTLPLLDQWLLGHEHRRVGRHFYSLGNLGLAGDIDVGSTYLQASARGLSVDANLVQQHTDVADDPQTARLDSRLRNVNLEYSPQSWTLAAGTPSVSAGLEQAESRQPDGDILLTGMAVDDRLRSAHWGLAFNASTWSASANWTRAQRDDDSEPVVAEDFVLHEPAADTRERSLGLDLSWTPSERLSIMPQWQQIRLRELVTGIVTRNELWGLQVQATLIPDVLAGQLAWNQDSDVRESLALPLGREQQDNRNATLELTYQPRRSSNWAPAFHWHLRGAYGYMETDFDLAHELAKQWAISLALSVDFGREAP